MRKATLALVALAAPLLGDSIPPGFPMVLAHADVPQDHGPQAVSQLLRTIPIGGSSGWHRHPGIEIGHVLSGVTDMRLADGSSLRHVTGESFVIPRGVVHNGVNAGKEPLLLVVTYITDKGTPVRIDMPDPAVR